jgi:hypothetical protein
MVVLSCAPLRMHNFIDQEYALHEAENGFFHDLKSMSATATALFSGSLPRACIQCFRRWLES